MDEERFCWDALPPELFRHILSFLDRATLANVPVVCKRWQEMFLDPMWGAEPNTWRGTYTSECLARKHKIIELDALPNDDTLDTPLDLAAFDTSLIRRIKFHPKHVKNMFHADFSALEEIDVRESISVSDLLKLLGDKKFSRCRAVLDNSVDWEDLARVCDGGRPYPPPIEVSSRPPPEAIKWTHKTPQIAVFAHSTYLVARTWAHVTVGASGMSRLNCVVGGSLSTTQCVFGVPGEQKWIEMDTLCGCHGGLCFHDVTVQCHNAFDVYSLEDHTRTVASTATMKAKKLIQTTQLLIYSGLKEKCVLCFNNYITEIHVRAPGLRSAIIYLDLADSESIIHRDLDIPGKATFCESTVVISACVDADNVVRLPLYANLSKCSNAYIRIQGDPAQPGCTQIVAFSHNVFRIDNGIGGNMYMW